MVDGDSVRPKYFYSDFYFYHLYPNIDFYYFDRTINSTSLILHPGQSIRLTLTPKLAGTGVRTDLSYQGEVMASECSGGRDTDRPPLSHHCHIAQTCFYKVP